MKRGAVNLEMAKPGAVLCQKSGAVSQLVPKLKESVPPPPGFRSLHSDFRMCRTPSGTIHWVQIIHDRLLVTGLN